MNEKLYIQKILKGDLSAFSYFVDTYQNMALTIAFRVCNNRQDAEDIVQNAFVKTYHNLHAFRLDSKFSTWFYRIVYNTSLTHIGGASFQSEYSDYEDIDRTNLSSDWNPMESINEKDRREVIDETLERLPKDESLVLSLFYLEENSIKDVAFITGMSEANVKVKLHRARKRFAGVLQLVIQDASIHDLI